MILSNVEGLTKGSEKKVKVQCDICQKITETNYSNYFNSQKRRLWPLTTYCRTCICKLSAEKRIGKPAHNKGKKLLDSQKRENHQSWKGGRYISSDGYVMINENNGKKGWRSYKKEHILLIEKSIGRQLKEKEVVHHIDGNKQNNDLDNLWLTDGGLHRKAHNSMQKIGFELFERGLIGFDKISGTYFLKEENVTRCNE